MPVILATLEVFPEARAAAVTGLRSRLEDPTAPLVIDERGWWMYRAMAVVISALAAFPEAREAVREKVMASAPKAGQSRQDPGRPAGEASPDEKVGGEN